MEFHLIWPWFLVTYRCDQAAFIDNTKSCLGTEWYKL